MEERNGQATILLYIAIAGVPAVVDDINQRLSRGERPQDRNIKVFRLLSWLGWSCT